VIKRDAWTNLAPVVDKGELDFLVRAPEKICDLSGNPSLFFICEPDPGSLGVNVLSHGPGGVVVMIAAFLVFLNYRFFTRPPDRSQAKNIEIKKKLFLTSA
jgi:hypothetical protein